MRDIPTYLRAVHIDQGAVLACLIFRLVSSHSEWWNCPVQNLPAVDRSVSVVPVPPTAHACAKCWFLYMKFDVEKKTTCQGEFREDVITLQLWIIHLKILQGVGKR